VAELPDRMDWEGEVAKRLAKLLQVQKGQILELLGDPPNLNNIPESVWQEHGDQLFHALEKDAFATYIAAAEHILASQPIGVDWGLINSSAASWARSNSALLVKDIMATTRIGIREAVASFFEQQLTIGDITAAISSMRDKVGKLLGPVRAELIASTEITRAAVQGELELVRGLGREGAQLIAVWQTRNDEIVCPICEPLNQRRETPEGGFTPRGEAGPGVPSPPAHPRCRCWLNHEFVGIGESIG
jgi:hypothetical protein